MTCSPPPKANADMANSIRLDFCIDEKSASTSASFKWSCNATYMIEEYWSGGGCNGQPRGSSPYWRRGCTPSANSSEFGLLVTCNGKADSSASATEPAQMGDWDSTSQSSSRTWLQPNSDTAEAIRKLVREHM